MDRRSNATADAGLAIIFANADLALFFAGMAWDLGLEDLALDIDDKVRAALAPFRRSQWVGVNGRGKGRR